MNDEIEEILSEAPEARPKRKIPWRLFLPYLKILIPVFIASLYVGNLLFGANSLEVLLELKGKRRELQQKVERLSQENAKLQKQYFELKDLDPNL